MMFKIMILQRYYGLADTQVEYQIPTSLSFKNFWFLKVETKHLMRCTEFAEVKNSMGIS